MAGDLNSSSPAMERESLRKLLHSRHLPLEKIGPPIPVSCMDPRITREAETALPSTTP